MSRVTTFKVGLLAIGGVLAAFVLAFLLGVRKPPADTYHTYFDESVQGLDVGATVKYRGVRIGNVAAIEIAPDRKHVDVRLVLERAKTSELQLEHSSQLRSRLAIQGVTGVKFIDLDFADPDLPPQALPFPPAERYIPSRPSLLEDFGRELSTIARRLPALLDHGTGALAAVESTLGEFRAAKLPARFADVLDRTLRAIDGLRHLVTSIDRQRLPDRVRSTLERVDGAVDQLAAAIAKLGGQEGLVDKSRRTVEAWGDVGRSTRDATNELEKTLRDLGDAARSFRELIEDLDRDPGMLLKGRARTNKP